MQPVHSMRHYQGIKFPCLGLLSHPLFGLAAPKPQMRIMGLYQMQPMTVGLELRRFCNRQDASLNNLHRTIDAAERSNMEEAERTFKKEPEVSIVT